MTIKKRIKKLVNRLNATDNQLFNAKNYKNASLYDGKDGRYLYIDNGSNILGIAHVDTVELYPRWGSKNKSVQPPRVDDNKITSIKLDDRLGVHILLDILPMMGITTDVLLTDDEEWAQSTAAIFTPTKKYNWIFSFDRRGVGECVMYQYSSDLEAVKRLYKTGWYVGMGSYSDIADLDAGCTGFNFSSGFVNEHTDSCYCQYESVMYNAQLFKKFYLAYKDVYMPFEYVPQARKYSYTYKTVDDTKKSTVKYDDYLAIQTCWYCGSNQATTWDMNGTPMCDDCSCAIYDDVKECEYCGMPIYPPESFSNQGETEDDLFDGICVSCANWLRSNMDDDDIASMHIKIKGNESSL